MDLAEYKKAWGNQPEEKNKVSAIEIYKMTQSKSTSIVKWIFIIGLGEFAFWTLLNFLFSGLSYIEMYEELNIMKYINFSYYIHFVVVILFLVIFYRNYASVSTIDDTKTLMRKIIRVRKTVKFYVLYNILGSILLMIIFNIIILNTPGAIEKIFEYEAVPIDPSKMVTVYMISQAIALCAILLFQFLFYYLLYGILLKKLKKNYKELTKLEAV
jgi:hypothetical protein